MFARSSRVLTVRRPKCSLVRVGRTVQKAHAAPPQRWLSSEADKPKSIFQRVRQGFETLREKRRGPRPPIVSVVRLKGVIADNISSSIGAGKLLNIDKVAPILDKAFKADPKRLKAVVLAVNSPGGSPVQSALIASYVRQLAQKSSVPVLCFTEDAAASGGYFLASAADEIFANESSLIGSIGVVTASFGFPDLIAKWGIERRVQTAGTAKVQNDAFQPRKEEDIQKLQQLLDGIHNNFISFVKERRGDKLKGSDEAIFNGEVFLAKEALELGLIDGIGDMRHVLRERYGEDVVLKVEAEKKSFRDMISGLGSPGMSAALSESSLESIGRGAVDGFMATAEQKWWWSRVGH